MTDPAIEQALRLWRKHVLPVAESQHVALMTEAELAAPPLVLLLGNHSSGKSSLINHLLGRDVQRTGVAPTDDGFTVLFHGTGGALDGEALSARPDLPFGRLRAHGPGLLRHLRGQPVEAPVLRDVWLVDSPGMIDAGTRDGRPYDFGAVVRSFAEQADLILVLFDPDKPGTTGETLQLLQDHLSGLEDRLRIVMNKMDRFEGLRDFARAYGALCWNLARALGTRDLPHIYTTSLPGRGGLSPESFAAALEELRRDVSALPQRRRDSQLSRMRRDARHLLLRARVTEGLRARTRQLRTRALARALQVAVVALALAALGDQFLALDNPLLTHLVWGALAVVAVAAVGGYLALRLPAANAEALDQLQDIFEAEYREALVHSDRELRAAWDAEREQLRDHLNTLGLDHYGPVSARALRNLRSAAYVDLPALHGGDPSGT